MVDDSITVQEKIQKIVTYWLSQEIATYPRFTGKHSLVSNIKDTTYILS